MSLFGLWCGADPAAVLAAGEFCGRGWVDAQQQSCSGTPTVKDWPMESTPGNDSNGVDLNEAARQLEQAGHDVRVAFDCIAFGELDRAHTHAITARAAVDAAENLLRVALGGDRSPAGR
jgi:hypothetical protein